jgi:site-specific DNA-methyltransferase (adenine-specific)
LNVDGSRVEHNEPVKTTNRQKDKGDTRNSNNSGLRNNPNNIASASQKGRFPANIIHDGSEEVVGCFPETKSGKSESNSYKKDGGYNTLYSGGGTQIRNADYGDNGSASRYFKTCPILDEDIETQRIFYTAKASKKERNAGLDGFEEKVGGGLQGTADKSMLTGSGNVRNNLMKNNHPTVKPIKLLEYLVGLVKMPENTVILDPFMGSGTTGIACVNNDVDFIGIELEPEYFDIAKARIEYAKNKLKQLSIV